MKVFRPTPRSIRFTKEGYEKLKKDYEELLALRPAAVLDLQKSRELGDLSENGFYKAARAKLSALDGKLRRISYSLKQAKVIENTNTNTINIGARIGLSDGKKEITCQIVGDLEADPGKNKISLLSPIGQAVAGRKVGDQVSVFLPSSTIKYKVTSISY